MKFSRSPVDCISRGFHCNTARATTRKVSALAEMRSGAPSRGRRKPPRAGPTIPERLSCTPPSVTAEGNSSLLTISGTIAPQTGALNASPIPSAKMQTSTEFGSIARVHAPTARSAEQAPCHSTALTMTARRFAMSATAPAGNVNRKNGAEAAVAIRESANEEAPRSCINHVAARSWADTNVPETTLASQRRQNIGFRSANQVEVDFVFIASGMKNSRKPSSRHPNFLTPRAARPDVRSKEFRPAFRPSGKGPRTLARAHAFLLCRYQVTPRR